MRLTAYLHRDISCPVWMLRVWEQLLWVLTKSQTTSTRFWFGMAGIGFGSFLMFSPAVTNGVSEYAMMMKLAPSYVWSLAFSINGLALLYGVFSQTYSKTLVIFEGLLGTMAWTTTAVTIVISQHTLGATVAGAAVAFWLLVRYPTHWEYKDAD